MRSVQLFRILIHIYYEDVHDGLGSYSQSYRPKSELHDVVTDYVANLERFKRLIRAEVQ